MAIKLVNRADPSGRLIDPANPTKDQVLNSTLLLQLDDDTTEAEATIRQIIANAVNDAVIRALQNVTRDLRYNANETWATAVDNAGLHATGASFGNTELQAVTDWAASYTIPSAITENTGTIVIRLPEGANPHDYRILLEDGSYANIDASLLIGFGTLSGFDSYLFTITFVGDYAKGNTLVLQHHGIEAHTDFLGGVPALEAVIQDLMTGKQDAVPFGFDLDHYYYVRTNTEPLTYYLALHDINASLLPEVDNLVVNLRGQPIHSAAFNPSANTEQVVPLEISSAEALNLIRNIQSSDTDLAVDMSFNDARTPVFTQSFRIPLVEYPPVREVDVLVPFDSARTVKTQILPAVYTGYREVIIGTHAARNSQEAFQHFPTQIFSSQATITGLGQSNQHSFNWDRASRTITYVPNQSANTSGIIFVELI